MALDPALTTVIALDTDDGFFAARPAARRILVEGKQTLTQDKSVAHNMQCLLSNMCAFGKENWSYEPGNAQQWAVFLAGAGTRTDCIQLARGFAAIAQAFGKIADRLQANPRAKQDALRYRNARSEIFDYKVFHPHETQAETLALDETAQRTGSTRGSHAKWYRMVSKPGVCDFSGKPGDLEIGGRWNFGNHSVAVVDNQVYDPSFHFQGFPYSAQKMDEVYVDWWVREEDDAQAFGGKKYVDVAGIKQDLYEYFSPGRPGRGNQPPVPGHFGMTFDRHKSVNSSL